MERELVNFLGREREKAVRIGEEECVLYLLSARELLSLRAAVTQKAFSDEEEKALWANSLLLSMSLHRDGRRAFADADAVLSALGLGEIATLVEQYAALDGQSNPSLEDGKEKIEALKKA